MKKLLIILSAIILQGCITTTGGSFRHQSTSVIFDEMNRSRNVNVQIGSAYGRMMANKQRVFGNTGNGGFKINPRAIYTNNRF